MATAEMQAAILRLGGTAAVMSADDSEAFVRKDSKRWAELIKSAGIKLDQ
jgi:tripartite-type tricarboxylate transporter receptor subunit TctC